MPGHASLALTLPWAKTGPRTWHPLVCHLIDVAVVALSLWEHLSLAWRRQVASDLGIDHESARHWFAFWAGLHDLGKASPSFQLQESARNAFAWDLRERFREADFYVRPGHIAWIPHGTIAAEVLPHLLVRRFGLNRRLATSVAIAAGGHHGVLPEPVLGGIDADAAGQRGWGDLRDRLADELGCLLGLGNAPRPVRVSVPTAMTLAGFVSVADWIGSNTEFFPHQASTERDMPLLDVEAYYRRASCGAYEALRRLGWTARGQCRTPRAFEDLFPRARPPYPVQRASVELAARLDPGPCLVLIEAPMGEGKSEAAMYLADRRAVDAGQDGYYFALPTQSTSNQMLGRVREFLEDGDGSAWINLQLLHGRAGCTPEIEHVRRDVEDPFVPEGL